MEDLGEREGRRRKRRVKRGVAVKEDVLSGWIGGGGGARDR